MTREEAIQTLQENAQLLHFEHPHLGIKEAIGVAIEALSQPSIPSGLDEAAKQFQGRWDNDQSPEASFKAGAQWRDDQIPKLPDSIDEAAEKYSNDSLKDLGAILRVDVRNAFKAGAEWMAGQGVISEGKVFTSAFTSYVKTPGIEKLLKDAFPEDTEVIVQIRKKQ